jgi:hypothetical protein
MEKKQTELYRAITFPSVHGAFIWELYNHVAKVGIGAGVSISY